MSIEMTDNACAGIWTLLDSIEHDNLTKQELRGAIYAIKKALTNDSDVVTHAYSQEES